MAARSTPEEWHSATITSTLLATACCIQTVTASVDIVIYSIPIIQTIPAESSLLYLPYEKCAELVPGIPSKRKKGNYSPTTSNIITHTQQTFRASTYPPPIFQRGVATTLQNNFKHGSPKKKNMNSGEKTRKGSTGYVGNLPALFPLRCKYRFPKAPPNRSRGSLDFPFPPVRFPWKN